MDPNSFRRLSAASTAGESVDVRANPGKPEDPQGVKPGVCPECYTCPNCEGMYRDILIQNPSADPGGDMWLLKDGIWENFGYSNVMLPRPSPGFRTVGSTVPRFVPSVGILGISAIDQSQHNSGSEPGTNEPPFFAPTWSMTPLSRSRQLIASSQVSDQGVGVPFSVGPPRAWDPGDSPLSLGALEYSLPEALPRYITPLREESSMNAQGGVGYPQSSDNFNCTWGVNDLGSDLQPPAGGYDGNPELGNMINNSESPPTGSPRFNHWSPHSKDSANPSFEAMKSSMTDDNDDSQYSITSTTPSSEPATPRFYCGACHRSYKRNYDLHRHEKNHLGVKPHKCPFPQCQSGLKGFVRSDHLIQHVKKKHPEPS